MPSDCARGLAARRAGRAIEPAGACCKPTRRATHCTASSLQAERLDGIDHRRPMCGQERRRESGHHQETNDASEREWVVRADLEKERTIKPHAYKGAPKS